MAAVIVRIALRYLAGILVARGLLSADEGGTFSADPDIQMLVETGAGVALGAISECWYWLAHRFGWAK
ncbi:hypothetical protein LGH82_31450 [Mesorhizobium sp. PAMC28654]|uniref:Pam3-gp28 family putative phage holin n=1 Tax=Mesorhizobium sp. PAMC28654 TaxID=2880934 RepID=UPI001D09AC4B|nr:hypothetical protein [Mesorhizobium sp. PAMC28654]UDL89518.1 hypothetical protein LGH82_31450 [Mesorhizobium sp. PAMC28654]